MASFEMGELRLALIIIGALLLLLIWAWEMHKRRQARRRVLDEWDGGEILATPEELAEDEVREELARMSELMAEDHPHRTAELDTMAARPAADERSPGRPPKDDATPRDRPAPRQGPDDEVILDLTPREPGLRAAPERPTRETRRAPETKPERRAAPPAQAPAERVLELIVVLYVVARSSTTFAGPEIREALEAAGLKYGDMQIYHRLAADGRSVFGVADMLEPGRLEPDRLATHTTAGLCFFMRLPGPVDGVQAFEDLLRVASGVAERLNGELRDDRRSVLTRQAIEHWRERLLEHRRQLGLASRQGHR
jgi:cell division protein ZipA